MMQPLPKSLLIADNQSLNDVVGALEQLHYFSIDTEFVRTDTFYPKIGLIQLSDGRQCWLIDPLEKLDFAPLIKLLENPAVTKIFHSCSEDLEVLQYSLSCTPRTIFDTQIAAALTGHGFSRGYAKLIEDLLDVSLNQHETRSDWLQRPLTSSQLQYAAEDVHYLYYLYEDLDRQLHLLGRQSWMTEEMERLVMNAAETTEPADYYQKVKGAWKLNRRSLGLLQLLCDWREQEARARNRPRRRIVDDKSLLDIAIKPPGSIKDVASASAMHPGTLRRYGESLLGLVRQGLTLDEAALPQPLPKPVPREAGSVLKKLKQLVAMRAEELNIPTEILAKRADLEQAMRSLHSQSSFPEKLLNGWRYPLVGQVIQDVLNEK